MSTTATAAKKTEQQHTKAAAPKEVDVTTTAMVYRKALLAVGDVLGPDVPDAVRRSCAAAISRECLSRGMRELGFPEARAVIAGVLMRDELGAPT